jgi:hypothetical protein
VKPVPQNWYMTRISNYQPSEFPPYNGAEKIISIYVVTFLDEYNISSNSQSDFLNTASTRNEMINCIIEIMNNNIIT